MKTITLTIITIKEVKAMNIRDLIDHCCKFAYHKEWINNNAYELALLRIDTEQLNLRRFYAI
jgi:hypothetical protein